LFWRGSICLSKIPESSSFPRADLESSTPPVPTFSTLVQGLVPWLVIFPRFLSLIQQTENLSPSLQEAKFFQYPCLWQIFIFCIWLQFKQMAERTNNRANIGE
jgi:hypothetical protein